MLYYYFKNKIDIYEVVVKEVLSSIYEEITISERCCDCAVGDLRVFISVYTQFANKHPYFPALLLRELSNSGRNLSDSVLEGCIRLFRLFSDILKRGEDEGVFTDVMPMVVFCMVISTVNILVVTKPLRQMAAKKQDGIDTCADCSVDEIAEYIFKKITLMLGVV